MTIQTLFKATFFSMACTALAPWPPCKAQQPPGAESGIIRRHPKAPLGKTREILPGEVEAQGLGDAMVSKLLFYSLPNPSSGCENCRASYFDAETSQGITIWRHPVMPPGCMNLVSSQFYYPTGIHRLFKNGPEVIVTFAVVSAAAGGILNIYRWDGGKKQFQDVSGPWNRLEQVDDVQFEDVDGDGNKEVIILHTTPASTATYGPRSIYRWDGVRYEQEMQRSAPKKTQ